MHRCQTPYTGNISVDILGSNFHCVFSYQRYYDLAIGVSLEVIWCRQGFPNDSVVVDLAVDCECNGLVLVGKGLRSTVNTDNTQTLVSKD